MPVYIKLLTPVVKEKKIKIEQTIEIIKAGYKYLLVVDNQMNIIDISSGLSEKLGQSPKNLIGSPLEKIMTSKSLEEIKLLLKYNSMTKGITIELLNNESKLGADFWLSVIDSDDKKLTLLYGAPSPFYDWEKEERSKELKCLYEVADWIEESKDEYLFFEKLPAYLAPGMLFPEKARVWIEYEGKEYGQRPKSKNYLTSPIILNTKKYGEIGFGYDETNILLLEEEQKLLNEIVRLIKMALERKGLNLDMSKKIQKEQDLKKRIEKLEENIQNRAQEFEKQKKKLEALDSYMTNTTKHWDETKARMEVIIKSIPDHVAIIDLDHKIILTNQEKSKIGEKCYKGFFDQDHPCFNCRLIHIKKQKTPVTTEIKHDNQHYQVQALPIFNEQQEVQGIIEYYRDITKEKDIEQQLQQADKLASLGELVSGIGHEINNPNQFIKGNVRIIKQAIEDFLPIIDEYYKGHSDLKIARLPYSFLRNQIMVLIDDMARGSQRIKTIVESLKRFARKDEGLLIDTVDINTIINESVRLVHNQIHKSADIHLKFNEIPTITGNSQKIEQITINLVINASQAMPDKKRGNIWIETFKENEYNVIKIKDDAGGMSEKVRKKIFDPFYTTKRAKGGTGLGLPIVYRIIEEHKGKIIVDSKLGQGTTFTIYLPIPKDE